MAKRFTDTDKWKKEWFQDLSPKMKCAWMYLVDNCDHAGIWPINRPLIKLQIGQAISIEEMLAAFGHRIKVIGETKILLTEFAQFQYGKLNPTNNTHRSVLKILENLAPGQDLGSPSGGLQDKGTGTEQDMDKDKGTEQDKERGPPPEGAALSPEWQERLRKRAEAAAR